MGPRMLSGRGQERTAIDGVEAKPLRLGLSRERQAWKASGSQSFRRSWLKPEANEAQQLGICSSRRCLASPIGLALLLATILLVNLTTRATGMQNSAPNLQMPFTVHSIASPLASSQMQDSTLVEVPGSPKSHSQLMSQPVTQIIYPNELYGPASLRLGTEPSGSSQSGSQSSLSSSSSSSSSSQHKDGNEPQIDLSASYVIENKRFVEAVSTRCFATTILDDPSAYEPEFIIIKPHHERRLNAIASLDRIQEAGFEPRKRTTILVHGFTQSYPNTTWLRRSRALFEEHRHVNNHNLIIMDWGRASNGPFSQAAAVVSGMGSFLANFIMKLTDLGADRMSIHIIGHSLGAHLAGFAGKRLKPRIGRITALDPAGPCFGKIFSNSPQDRLAPDDAFEVDVYHYDDDFLGLPGQHGQFDIYVNGGSSQPGCQNNVNAMFQAMLTMIFRRNRVLSESHTRSTEVVSISLARSGCQGIAYECRDYASFLAGECGKCDEQNNQCFLINFGFQYDQIEQVALRSSFPGKKLYISTGPTEEYCMQHYQILVKFEPHPDMRNAAKRDKWRCILELVDDSDRFVTFQLSNQMAPNVFSGLLLVGGRPGRYRAARLQVKAHDGNLVNLQRSLQKDSSDKGVSHRVFTVEVNFMSNINPNIRRTLSSQLCPLMHSPAITRPWDQNNDNSIGDTGSVFKSEWLDLEECMPRFG